MKAGTPDRAKASGRARAGAPDGAKVSASDAALTVDIQVVPRASRVAVGPAVGTRLRVAVTAPPVDGEANAAVIDALARAFGVRRAAVEIVRGTSGRKKTVRIAGATRAAFDQMMAGGVASG